MVTSSCYGKGVIADLYGHPRLATGLFRPHISHSYKLPLRLSTMSRSTSPKTQSSELSTISILEIGLSPFSSDEHLARDLMSAQPPALFSSAISDQNAPSRRHILHLKVEFTSPSLDSSCTEPLAHGPLDALVVDPTQHVDAPTS